VPLLDAPAEMLGPNTGIPVEAQGDPPEIVNLVTELSEDELKDLAKAVEQGFEDDRTSREPRMRRMRKAQKLVASDLDPKTVPFQNAANVNVPVLLNALRQYSSRLWDMLVPGSGNISHVNATSVKNVERAQAAERYFNSFIKYELPVYALSWYQTIYQVCGPGSGFRRRCYDLREKRIRVDSLSMENVVVSYNEQNLDPTMRGVRRYSVVLRMDEREMAPLLADKTFVLPKDEGTKGLNTGDDEIPKSEFAKGIDKIDGVNPPADSKTTRQPHSIIEQYLWWKLPSKKKVPGFDGEWHPIIAWLDVRSRKVMRVVLREEDDPTDKRRFDRQVQDKKDWMAALMMRQPEMDEMGNAVPGSMEMQPEPPEPEPVRQRETCFLLHVRGFASDGFYGSGFYDTLGALNAAINVIANQVIDTGTMKNAGGGWYSSQIRMPTGGLSFSPGEYHRIEGPAALLKDGIRERISPEPSVVSMPMVQFLQGSAEQATSSGGVMSGEKPASHEAATTTQIRVEEARSQILVLARLIAIAMSAEFVGLWRDLSLFLDENEAQRVVDDDGTVQEYRLKRSDFVADADVMPSADPGVTSQSELVAKAQGFLGAVMQNPLTAQSPEMVRAATVDYLSAIGKRAYVKLIPPAPPPGPPPPVPQWKENAGFLMEQDSQVNPQDDDDEHLHEMGLFRGDPYGYDHLTPTGQKMYDAHARAHMASKLIKERTADHAPQQLQAV
jgi:hypothetical protein